MKLETMLSGNSVHYSFTKAGERQRKASESQPVSEGSTGTDALTRWLWGLLVFSLPFVDCRFPEAARAFGQPSTYLTLMLWVLVPMRILYRKEKLPFLKNKALLFMFLFWLVAGLSISQSSQAPLSPWIHYVPWVSGVKQFVGLSVSLSVAFFTAFFVRSWRDFRFAMTSYFAGWIGSVLAQLLDFAAYFRPNSSVLQAANNFMHYFQWWQFIGPFPRLRLGGAEASWASDYLICVIPFFVLRAYYWKSRRWNLINALASILVLFGTMSFGGLAVFLGQAALMAVILGRRAVGFLALTLGAPLLLALVVSPIYVDVVWERSVGVFDYGIETSDGSVRARAAQAEIAWAIFEEHPWLGAGIGISNYYAPGYVPNWIRADPYAKKMTDSFEESNLANLPSQVLSETGLAGTCLFVLLLVTMVWGTLKAYRRATEGWKKSVYAAILVALLGQIAHYTSVNQFGLKYWFFIWGLAIFAQQSSTSQTGAAHVPGHRAAGHRPKAAALSRAWVRAC